jgi:hypothetical protein
MGNDLVHLKPFHERWDAFDTVVSYTFPWARMPL